MRVNDSARRDPIAALIAGALLLACCAAAAVFEHKKPIAPRHYVEWRNPEEARRIAIATKRPILFSFVKERDVESARFERDLFADAESGARIDRNFVGVRIVDVSNSGRRNSPFTAGLESQFQVGRLPAIVVTNADATRHELLARHRTRTNTMAFLERAAREVARPQRDPDGDARRAYVTALAQIGSASSPSLSPDGKRVAFVSDLSGQPQLWRMDVDGGFPELVASMGEGVNAAQWSPDGQWIAFASGVMRSQIYVVRPDGRDLRQVTNGNGRNVMTSWTDDGLLPVNVARAIVHGMESSLYDPATGTSRIIATHPEFGVATDIDCNRAILLRRSGSRRATFVASAHAERELFSHDEDEQTTAWFAAVCSNELVAITNHGRDRSAFVKIRGQAIDVLWSRNDAELMNAVMTRDRTRVALVWNLAGREELGLLDLRTGAREIVPLPVDILGALSFSNDGTRLVFSGSNAKEPSNIWLLNIPTRSVRQLTRSAHAGVDLTTLVVPELVRFRGADGLELAGWLYRAAQPGRAVISLHGGPSLQETAAMNPTYHALVAAGISVFAPNVRGSLGFGRRFLRLDDGEQRENAIADVRSAAELLIARGVAARGRIGVMGESYGGWLTLAVTTRHPDLFAAAVDQYGTFDLKKMIDQAIPEIAPMFRAEYGDDATLARFSIDGDALRTPTLVLQGALDGITGPSQSNEAITALRKNRTPSEYILFPDEGHGWRKTPNRVRAALAITEWFEKWL